MKRIMFAGILALAAGTQALAADLPPPSAPPPRAPATYVPTMAPVYNWGGVYIGINGGYGFGKSNWTAGAVSTGNFNTSGGLAGGTVGANYQVGQFVLGVEADIDWSGVKGTSSKCTGAGVTCQTGENWLGTLRGRAGFALDRVLFFATAGGAYGNVQATSNSTGPSITNTTTNFGWTAGAGVEAALDQNWTVKAEYLYVDLSNGTCTTACGVPNFSVSFTESLVRAGVNYKFNF